jgi:uncharacterized membrane protein YeaQ/YmgE (transglycosylase-associated protein family)
MNLTALIVQLIGGALGGYAAGSVSKEMNLGTIGNAIVGALGGGVGGQVFFYAAWVERYRTSRLNLINRRSQRRARYASQWISKIQDITA